jgi:hypothetical protein
MISNTTAAGEIIDVLDAHGVTFDDLTVTKAALAAVVNDWNGVLSNASLAARVSALVSLFSGRDQAISDWALGTYNGGPLSDGVYPITVQGGGTVNVKSPARLAFDAAGFNLQGSQATTGALPASGNEVGDTWIVTANNHLWAWSAALTWVDMGVAGAPGATGPSVELRVSGGQLQYRAVGSSGAWTNIVAMSALVGADGPAIEQRVSGGYIQWRVVGDPTWINLIALSALAGADSTVPGPAAWQLPVAFASGITAVVGPPTTTVVYLGETYVCITGHTTTGTFDPSKWIKVAAKGSDGSGARTPGIYASDYASAGADHLVFTAAVAAWFAAARSIAGVYYLGLLDVDVSLDFGTHTVPIMPPGGQATIGGEIIFSNGATIKNANGEYCMFIQNYNGVGQYGWFNLGIFDANLLNASLRIMSYDDNQSLYKMHIDGLTINSTSTGITRHALALEGLFECTFDRVNIVWQSTTKNCINMEVSAAGGTPSSNTFNQSSLATGCTGTKKPATGLAPPSTPPHSYKPRPRGGNIQAYGTVFNHCHAEGNCLSSGEAGIFIDGSATIVRQRATPQRPRSKSTWSKATAMSRSLGLGRSTPPYPEPRSSFLTAEAGVLQPS